MATSIERFIERVCVQTAVYWGNPVNDGFGGKTYDPAIEVNVRWENKTQTIVGPEGKEMLTAAEVLVTQDLDMEGLLYLGELTDFTPLQLSSPVSIEGTYEIIGFDKIPLFRKTSNFVRKAYLKRTMR